jgi:ribonuclease BN (tRNA processing enzyme)
LVKFAGGADLVIYDGMFAESEYSWCKGWGHSTWHKGVELCRAADVRSLAIVHHCPGHTDAALREIEAELKSVMPTAFLARERQALVLSAREPSVTVAAPGKAAKVPSKSIRG